MQSTPQEESYGRESVDPGHSHDGGGGLGGNLGETLNDTALDPDSIVDLNGDEIEKQLDHHHGVEHHHHHRQKRQARRVDWTSRRSTVSKIYLLI